MKEPSSLRDWAGPVLGVALGLSFGYILTGDGTTAGPAFFALLIVPFVQCSPTRSIPASRSISPPTL
jgi:hypothetical protein